MSALAWVFVVAGAACVVAWSASLITHDTSWVDRMWSILPEVYVWIFALHTRPLNARLMTLAVLTTLWGARLTFNFARKGGYSGVEDYRWAVLRRSMSRGRFQLFNLFFIVIYQNTLLVLIALPAWTVAQRTAHWSSTDVALSVAFLALLAGETVADEQQWRFHVEKRRRTAARLVTSPGFLREGLFRYSRHPNYFFEIAQWWVVYLFAVEAARTLVQWTALGAVLLTLLFVGSTRFTEAISASKYPAYREYQREVSAIVPWRPRRRRDESVITDAEGG